VHLKKGHRETRQTEPKKVLMGIYLILRVFLQCNGENSSKRKFHPNDRLVFVIPEFWERKIKVKDIFSVRLVFIQFRKLF
jgi:hypothetical protein